jgi:hypothetical protein
VSRTTRSLRIALFGLRHVRDLFRQIGQIETLERARLQQRNLLLDPQAEIALVERGRDRGSVLRARHDDVLSPGDDSTNAARRASALAAALSSRG